MKIVLRAPDGVAFGETTREPAGWTVSRSEDTITWSGGRVKPDHFDTWGYEIEGADQSGTLAYKVDLTFADGRADNVEVDVTATAPTTTTTGAPSTTTSTGTAAPATRSTSSSTSGTANAALAVAIAALLVGVLALAAALRRRPASSGPGGSEPRAQDW